MNQLDFFHVIFSKLSIHLTTEELQGFLTRMKIAIRFCLHIFRGKLGFWVIAKNLYSDIFIREVMSGAGDL